MSGCRTALKKANAKVRFLVHYRIFLKITGIPSPEG